MKKLLYAMRHCETLFNVQHKSQGWCDSPITPRGVEQCRIAGEELKRRGVVFDHFYSSTSERCCDTMELVCQTAFGEVKPYERKKGLRECGFGIFEAKDDFIEPEFGPGGLLQMRGLVMSAAGGEGDAQVNERIVSCMSEIMANPDVRNVLVVGSGGSLVHFYMQVMGFAFNGPRANTNCMTYVYEWEDGVFSSVEVYQQDFDGLDCGGLDGSGVPNRWAVDLDAARAAFAE
ncbi:MAG: histidine phosphatase family protein [Coriobacteriales bacterium]|nr:histidine phosphatase family protein [Coriobacteriales bacterium]